MDALNKYIKAKNLPDHLCVRLRRYFRSRKDMNKQAAHTNLLSKLSPKLMEDTCAMGSSWLTSVPYLSSDGVSMGFLVTISNHLVELMFEPRESITWRDTLNGVSRGFVSVQGRICTTGFAWGDDFVLDSSQLKDKRSAVALTYLTVLTLKRSAFLRVINDFPTEKRIVRKATVRLAMQRGECARPCHSNVVNFV